uniref:KIB1-4 beta-propeller domain-containing protein n=1 Tax=Hordeum vulgare subsp. vulgare TaxID=112509 RepID=A0A8I6XLG9_HORVV
MRFRAVCRPWRRSSVDPRIRSSLDRRFHPWRWLMLRDPLAAPNRRRFLNPSTGKCVRVDVPELRDHQVLALTHEGLLVLLHDINHVCLLNPLTRHLTQLPPLSTLLPHEEREYLLPNYHTKFAAWGSGILNDDSTVLLYFNFQRMIGIAKPGDVSWRRFEFTSGVRSAISIFTGRLYCVTGDCVMVLEDQPPRLEFAAKLCMRVCGVTDIVHLVACAGELMLVHRRFSRRCDRNNVSKRRYEPVSSGSECWYSAPR